MRRKKDPSDLIMQIVQYTFILIFSVLCLYPFYYVIIYSISDPKLAASGIWLLPKGFSLETYSKLFARGDLGQAFIVSIARTVIGTCSCVFFTTMFAFLITRKELPAKKVIYRFTIMTMYISAGMIPWYLTMKAYHLKNSFLLYVVPGTISAYYMILIKTFIEQLPKELEESAELDGAGFFDTLFKVVMPLSKPIIATVAVYSAVGQWNSWTDNFFLISDKKIQTVQLILYNYINSANSIAQSMKMGGEAAVAAGEALQHMVTPESVQMTAIVVTVVPIMLVYPFAQKYFTKGIMMGAVKG